MVTRLATCCAAAALAGLVLAGDAGAQSVVLPTGPGVQSGVPPAGPGGGGTSFDPTLLPPNPTLQQRPALAVPAASDVQGRFRAAYERQKRPRIAIYWNRSLTAEASDASVQFERETSNATTQFGQNGQRQTGGAATVEHYWGGAVSTFDAGSTSSLSGAATTNTARERVTGTTRIDTAQRPLEMNDNDAWRLESAFIDSFARAGARLVDRNVIMRVASLSRASGDGDRIEAAALKDHADLLLEVWIARDPESPSGYVFRISGKSIRTGEILANLVSDGADPRLSAGSTQFVATNHGFEPRPARGIRGADGAEIAAATMQRLIERW